MDGEEKLIALKKAYADIILNISKEAAARVMSSERKAVQYQHELKVVKEEALRMLLHLKQMMDSKTSEAEAAALNQQKKIEELEAQLHEAEDIVKDLREELGEVQAEMERIKKDNMQNVNEPNYASSREMASSIYSYQPSTFLHPNSRDEFAIASDVTMPNQNQQSECCKCYSSNKGCMCGSYIRNRGLPNIILRDKEPGLYRNGCTQRIRACERNLLDSNNSGEQEEGEEDTSKAPSSGDKILTELDSTLLANIKQSSFQLFHQKRKRGSRQRKSLKTLTRKPNYPAAHIPVSVKENAHYSENPSEIDRILSLDKAEMLQKDEGLEEKTMGLGKDIGFAESLLSPICKVDDEKVDMLSNSLEGNLSDKTVLSSRPVKERVIKYTFQRKRKRGDLSGSEVNASPDTEKRTGDKRSGHPDLEPSKSSLLMESSRDSRRLAQVARQLISLSEKKWWR